MLRLSRLFFRLLLLLCALAFLAILALQALVATLGTTTIADGYRLLKDQVPDWVETVLAAPWWVAALAAAVPALWLIWPRRPPEAAPAYAEAEPVREEPASFERARKVSSDPYLKEQHIYPGSAKLSMMPEFRAIPARYISRAKLFIEYSAYSSEDHAWGGIRRILVAEIEAQQADEWSVINVELMTSYEEGGRKIWRWVRELDYGAPHDDDYLFTIKDHYHGRVVFVGPDETVQHSYFAIVPSKDAPSEIPNVVSHGLFDFVEAWEAQDREDVLTI